MKPNENQNQVSAAGQVLLLVRVGGRFGRLDMVGTTAGFAYDLERSLRLPSAAKGSGIEKPDAPN